jgi:BCD family chlorophyll transporter-like MFS transporter
MAMGGTLGWFGIVRLGLVQTALGAIVVLTTATLNRVMVVELALAATIPGALVGLHYAVQILRPFWGHRSDGGRRRTPWIVGGIATLGAGGALASAAVALMTQSLTAGLALATFAFLLVGIGVGAAGTSLLALLASAVAPERRPAAATIVWLMMIAGMAITAVLAGSLLDPYSPQRLVAVTSGVAALALALAGAALWGVERRVAAPAAQLAGERPVPFRESLADAWGDPQARIFTIFVFVSMLAYSAQDLILEPFAGLVFGMTPGETTQLAGLQHGGVFAGMVLTGVLGTLLARRFTGILRTLTITGCVGSAVMIAGLVMAARTPAGWPLVANVVALGFANGVFAVAAIGSMMALAGKAGPRRTGMRMGLWGAAQAIAFGLGGLAGTVAVDLARLATDDVAFAYASVFALEGAAFLAAALLAARVATVRSMPAPTMVPAE